MRGLAALAVFAVHFNQIVQLDHKLGPFDVEILLANGEYGVALFFILSGFLLGLPFWKTIRAGQRLPPIRVYAIRRLARILPAYYVALTALILLGGLWQVPGAYADIILHYSFLFSFAEFSFHSINPPFWTLAIEMQFYLLLPLFFLILQRTSDSNALWLLLIFCFLAYAANVWIIGAVTSSVRWPFDTWLLWIRPYGAVVSHSTLAHLPHFLLGVATGYLFLRIKQSAVARTRDFQIACELAFWLSLCATILLLGTGLEEKVTVPHGRYGLPILPLLLGIMIFSAPSTNRARRWLDGFPLRHLGTISYGIYIYHYPCQNWTYATMTANGIDVSGNWALFGLVSFGFTAILATLSFVVIEKPILGMAKRLR